MIHPSYLELMEVINEGVDVGEEPVVNSRYSIVCATAKRARQLIDGAEPLVEPSDDATKPLSIAVQELYTGNLTILPEGSKSAEEQIAEEESLSDDDLILDDDLSEEDADQGDSENKPE